MRFGSFILEAPTPSALTQLSTTLRIRSGMTPDPPMARKGLVATPQRFFQHPFGRLGIMTQRTAHRRLLSTSPLVNLPQRQMNFMLTEI